MNSYELSRTWFNFCFDNPDKVKPIHSAIYFFAIEHCNRLGWKKKFGFPSQMVMEAIGVKNWRTYSKALNEIVEWGFIDMVEISKNQYSSNIIAIVKNTKAPTKALDKALSNHLQKHCTKHSQSTVSIDKQLNNKTIKQITIPPFEEFKQYALDRCLELNLELDVVKANLKYTAWKESGWKTGGDKPRPIKNWKSTLNHSLKYLFKDEKNSGKKTAVTTNR